MSKASRTLAWVMAPLVILILCGWLLAVQPVAALRLDTADVTAEQARILQRHIWRGELCEPLRCWIEVRITSITRLEQAVDLSASGGPFMRSDQISVTGTCSAGAYLAEGYTQDRWWNRYVPVAYDYLREPQPFTLCLHTP